MELLQQEQLYDIKMFDYHKRFLHHIKFHLDKIHIMYEMHYFKTSNKRFQKNSCLFSIPMFCK
jgi:hypothetical protein